MNTQTLGRGLLVVATVVVLGTVAAAIVVIGTPAQQRELRLDERRTSDLQRIVEAAREHADRTGALALDLTTLASRPGLRLSIIDPVTTLPYAYEVQNPQAFRVCATFTTDTAVDALGPRRPGNDDWLHGVGRHCFDRTWKPPADAAATAEQD